MQTTKTLVRDLMQTNVVRLDPDATVRDGIASLEEARITGAPVVDGAGRVLGVVSLRDLADAAEAGPGRPEGQRSEYYLADADEDRPFGEPDELADVEDYSPRALPDGTLADWMTTEIVTIAPDRSIRDAARAMVENGVHRLLVVEEERLAGILTTTDVVRFVAEQR